MERAFYGKPSEVPEGSQMLEAQPAEDLSPQRVIGEEQIADAITTLQKYKSGKANLEARIRDDELWWELRHWETVRKKKAIDDPKPTSAWLHNTIVSKHADAMDNFPEPLVLPRERSDEESAKILSAVLPVVMDYNDFDATYRSNWWEKLKHGTGVYGVFWDSKKENGLGDISIKPIDLMKIFYEPGITDIQESRNLFIVEQIDTDLLDEMYPEHKGKMKGGSIDVTEYSYDDEVDTSEKSLVVDWYYKVTDPSGRTVLHYCKFCNKEVLYATENDPELAMRGLYDHGMYPVVFDVLFPEKGTPVGFGYVAISKDPQIYIDELSANILESSMMNTKKRYFMSESTAVNEEEFLDWSKPIVHVAGEIGEHRIQELISQPLSPVYTQVLQMKIEEMKETSSNRDLNNGGASQITAAAAISALQESGNKVSRQMISASYRAYEKICKICIELMRQFYDVKRAFRVTMPNQTDYQFMDIDNQMLGDQVTGIDSMGQMLYRKPIFDVKIRAQKRNPFSLMEANQRAQELYAMGFFNPQKAQESSIALNMMEFEGIDKVREAVMQGQTLQNMVQQLMGIIQQLTGVAPPMGGGMPAPQPPQGVPGGGQSIQKRVSDAGTPMTPYGQRLAQRSTPDANMGNVQRTANE